MTVIADRLIPSLRYGDERTQVAIASVWASPVAGVPPAEPDDTIPRDGLLADVGAAPE
ncbi:hypothetical protein [Streptomyces sp. NPDC006463]|uniref:hypothetical protein n=1 Tax=Streptomyces sp. NPDC006463 TaxID=3364746 RepID=UPI0036B6C589